MIDSTITTAKKQVAEKSDADYVFYELTRSICPTCRRAIDAKILLRDNKVYMHKRCPEHGQFEALIYGDAQAYTEQSSSTNQARFPCNSAQKWFMAARMIVVYAQIISSTPV